MAWLKWKKKEKDKQYCKISLMALQGKIYYLLDSSGFGVDRGLSTVVHIDFEMRPLALSAIIQEEEINIISLGINDV